MPKDGVFFSVKGHLAETFSHVAVVGIGHLSGTVDYAAHDGYDNVLEMGRALLDLVEGGLEVVEGSAATGACNVLRLIETAPAGLHYLVFEVFVLNGNVIDLMVKKGSAPVAGGLEERFFAFAQNDRSRCT